MSIEQPWLDRDWWARVAIIGTARSWKETPWDDPTLRIVGLNDLYALGIPRADAWFELHPLDHMWFRKKAQKVLGTHEVPAGHYARPEGHHEWLQAQAQRIPVWLQEVPDGWLGHFQRFPIEPILAFLGGYVASGPTMIASYAICMGVQELHVYGIHLETQAEYVEQRPNFESVLGRYLGCEELHFTVEGNRRKYVGTKGRTLYLPVSSPILQHNRIYAYQPKPEPPAEYVALKARLARVQAGYQHICEALVRRPWYRLGDRKLIEERERLEAKLGDLQQQVARWAGQRSSSKAQSLQAPAA